MELGTQQLFCKGGEEYLRNFIGYMAAKNPAISRGAIHEGRTDEACQWRIYVYAAQSLRFYLCGDRYFRGRRHRHLRSEPAGAICRDVELLRSGHELWHYEHVVNQYLSLKTMHEITKRAA
jgi:hypothetical protein